MVAAISGESWWSGTDSNCYAPTYEVGSLPLELPDLQVLLIGSGHTDRKVLLLYFRHRNSSSNL